MDKNSVENFLLQNKSQIESSLEEIEESLSEQTSEIEQLAAAAYEDERNNRILVIKKSLEEMLENINKSLKKMKNHTYGICDSCRQMINPGRLQVMPTTNLCISCISNHYSHSSI